MDNILPPRRLREMLDRADRDARVDELAKLDRWLFETIDECFKSDVYGNDYWRVRDRVKARLAELGQGGATHAK